MASAVELQQYRREFWLGVVREGLSTVAAARQACVSEQVGRRWFRECGGVAPVDLTEPRGRYLSLSEREELSRGLAAGESLRVIAAGLGRAPSTVSREVTGNGGRADYRALAADQAAWARRSGRSRRS